MKPIKWVESPSGSLLSEATRFAIKPPRPLDVSNEIRVALVDRIGGGQEKVGNGVCVKSKTYLCLSIEDAKSLAEDIRRGKGCLSP